MAFKAAALLNEWNKWNIRGFMILCLCVQVLLATVAPQRQRTSNRFLIPALLYAYVLYDWAPTFASGLISNAGSRNLENNEAHVHPDILALWAAFILVHLGGPDNITAFSMDDNALWMRHVIGFYGQVYVYSSIYLKTLPNNILKVPTTLVYLTGVINYWERSRALILASLESLKETIKEPELRSEGFDISHNILKGLIVDIVPDLQESDKSRAHIFNLQPRLAFFHITVQLRLLYELLYTKIKASNSKLGMIVRVIASYSTFGAFIVFWTVDKHQFYSGDIVITYALFAGAFILHTANVMTLLTSSFSHVKDIPSFVFMQGCIPPLLILGLRYIIELTPPVYRPKLFVRTWSRKMAYFNILSHLFKQSTLKKAGKLGFIWNKLAGDRHVSWEDIDMSLWISIYEDVKEMAAETTDTTRLRELYEARGDRALRRIGCDQLIPYIEGFQFDHTLLIWHIATEICFNIEAEECYNGNEERKEKRISSKKLSDYMMYLLVSRPTLMSAVAGISHIRYKDTCAEVKLLGTKNLEVPTIQEFCRLILTGHADIEENKHQFSVLKDSRKLVELLSGINNMWEIFYMVWMELLLYAAGHCRADSHARVLCEGSEFITAIWALMSLCGIGYNFPVISPSPGLPDGTTSCANPPAGVEARNADRTAAHALRVRRWDEDAVQVAVDDNNIAEDPNLGQVAVGALRVPQQVENADQVVTIGNDHAVQAAVVFPNAGQASV